MNEHMRRSRNFSRGGGADAYFWWFFIANLKKFEFCIGGRGSGPPDTPLDPCMEQFRMKIARNNGVD